MTIEKTFIETSLGGVRSIRADVYRCPICWEEYATSEQMNAIMRELFPEKFNKDA